MAQTPKEEYTYHVGKIDFIVTPVYKGNGESFELNLDENQIIWYEIG